jgi:hypothetical protein
LNIHKPVYCVGGPPVYLTVNKLCSIHIMYTSRPKKKDPVYTIGQRVEGVGTLYFRILMTLVCCLCAIIIDWLILGLYRLCSC